MSKRPALILQPVHNSSADIFKRFAAGKPLNSDQERYLSSLLHKLSSQEFDPVLDYYIHSSQRRKYTTSFLMPSDQMSPEAVQKLRKRLRLMLPESNSQAVIGLTEMQYLKFRELTMSELIFWHGNQTLSSAPMFPGGIPPVLLFQWGNYFGVVKYLVLAGEKTLKANLLIYFEDMLERNLNQCVKDYRHKLKLERKMQQEILLENDLEPEPYSMFLIKTPTLLPT